MPTNVDPRMERFLRSLRLVQEWGRIDNGQALLADLMIVAGFARTHSQDILAAASDHPALSNAFALHPHLLEMIQAEPQLVHDLLDALEIYEAAAAKAAGELGADDLGIDESGAGKPTERRTP